MNYKLLLILSCSIIISSCHQGNKIVDIATASTSNFIEPPIASMNIPYKEYKVDAAKGDTLYYQTGSIILLPSNSFIDKYGNVVKGEVKIKYREFTSPIDFYLSGIPMDYDSAGKKFSFESFGMCEVLASKDGEPVFVNPKSKPEINVVSTVNSNSPGLYYLDSAQRKWVTKGTAVVTDLGSTKMMNKQVTKQEGVDFIKPVKPEKATDNNRLIQIVIDPSSFKELMIYDNQQFQVEPNETNYNPKDTAEEWSNVELNRVENGLYRIKFSNANRSVSYVVKPVLKGKDYDKALQLFEAKSRVYNKEKAERLNKEMANKEHYINDSLANETRLEENKRIEQLNILIRVRNKEIEKQNQLYAEENLSNKIFRSFQIDGFGIWNCDKAIALDCLPVTATFKDQKGQLLNLTNVTVLYKSFNGILRFSDNKILVVKDADNMIIGIANGRFAYITYENYKMLKINASIKEQVFTMSIVSEKNNTYDFIKKLTE